MSRSKKTFVRDKGLRIRLHQDEHDLIKHFSDEVGMSMSDFIRNALSYYILTGTYKKDFVKEVDHGS